ncbi:MAG: hypothetical protein FWE61_01650 [Micrococcales bacterium]|nr:hypothetical protein [Micrococcales bacterium]
MNEQKVEPVLSLDDPRLGSVDVDSWCVDIHNLTTPLGPLFVSFIQCGDRAEVEAHLPVLNSILERLPALWPEAVRFLWEARAREPRTEETKQRFLAAWTVMGVGIFSDGSFAIHLCDEREEFKEWFFDHGYWPAVQFSADGTAEDWTIEG